MQKIDKRLLSKGNSVQHKGIFMNKEQCIRILHLTDTHLFADRNRTLLGVNTYDNLQLIVREIIDNQINPHMVILSGDLSHDGSEASYRMLHEAMTPLNSPYYVIAGNHDHLANMNALFSKLNHGALQKQLCRGVWQVILLNTHLKRNIHGKLNRSELSFLEHCLTNNPHLFTLIILHHPPWIIHSSWLDAINLKNHQEFWRLIQRFSSVKMVVSGHVHQAFERQYNDIWCYSTPATSIQFKPNCHQFTLDILSPGYRIIDLFPNTSFCSQIRRVSVQTGIPQQHLKGY